MSRRLLDQGGYRLLDQGGYRLLDSPISPLQSGLTGACLIFKPGGFTSAPGTLNYLQSLDQYATQVVWTTAQIGDLQQATIRNRIAYENVMNIQAGNWVVFGCLGGITNTLTAGSSSIIVPYCTDDLSHEYIQNGDSILVTDGINAEIFKASSVSYSGNQATITLGSAPSQNTSTLLNTYPSGAKVVRLLWQGLITARKRTTDLSNIFDITVNGMMWRYSKAIGNFDLVQEDSATSLLQLATLYDGQVPQIIINSANFAGANGIIYSGTAQNTPLATMIADILKTESGGAVPSAPNEATFWSFWVDELRQAHHAQVPTQNSSSPTYTIDLLNGSSNGDVLGAVQPQDMDMSRLLNVVLVQGGNDSNGNPVDIIITVQPSYQIYGFYEGYLSNPNITDPTALATWAAGQVGVLAWPQQTGRMELLVDMCRMTARDLLNITGFTDGSTLITNPITIQRTADFQKQIVTGAATIQQEQPNVSSMIAEYGAEKSLRQSETASAANLQSSYVVEGLTLTTSGLTWSTTAGVIVYNGTEYTIPASSGTMFANDIIKLGIQVSGTAPGGYSTPCVCPMPSFTYGGVRKNAHQWYELQNTGGSNLSLNQMTSFTGLYFATLTSGASTIAATQRKVSWGGLGTRYAQTLRTGVLQKNLVLNGNNWFGGGAVNPSVYGWKNPYSGGAVASSSGITYIVNGTTYTPIQATNLGEYQDIPVVPGQTYTFCAEVQTSLSGSSARLWIGDTGFASQWNASPGAPLGALGSFYSGASHNAASQSNAGVWETIYGTFTVPNSNTTARVIIGGTGSGQTTYFAGVQIVQGNRLQDYADHEPNPSYLNSSSPLNNQGSVLNWANVPVVSYTLNTTSIQVNVSAATLIRTDGTSLSVSSYSHTYSGLSVNTAYWFDVWYDVVNNVYNSSYYSTAISAAQIMNDCFADGRLAIAWNDSHSTASSGSSSGSGSGGGGQFLNNQCPAIHQLIETRERGFIRADELQIGMHIPSPFGGWNAILRTERAPAPIWRLSVENALGDCESFDVNDTHAVQTLEGEWVRVRDMQIGQRLRGAFSPLTVTEARYLFDGIYVPIEVETHEYLLGSLCSHNPWTLA